MIHDLKYEFGVQWFQMKSSSSDNPGVQFSEVWFGQGQPVCSLIPGPMPVPFSLAALTVTQDGTAAFELIWQT